MLSSPIDFHWLPNDKRGASEDMLNMLMSRIAERAIMIYRGLRFLQNRRYTPHLE